MPRTLKLYHFRLEEHSGEQEYAYDHLCYAVDQAEAERIAHQYASDFYGSDYYGKGTWNEGYECFEFFGGAIMVEVDSVRETTPKEYMEQAFKSALVNMEE